VSVGKRVEFTIRVGGDRRFYAHLEHGNGRIVWTGPHGRASLSSAGSLCDSAWRAFCEQIDPDHSLQWPPTPYSAKSLLPRRRVS
jgi:hypothetical protein